MTKITPAIKGLITGILMVAAGLFLILNKISESSPLQFISYFIYGLGIVWTVQAAAKQVDGSLTFGQLFNQGFKCFVVVTLIMAVFTIIYYKANANLIEEKGELTKKELLKTEKNRTPAEINEMVANGKKYFIPMATSMTVFQYLLIGAIVTAAAAGTLSLSKKK
ncbi:MAG: DUF4199 domain-containing protein [Niabella sp.]